MHQETSWTEIESAATGDPQSREAFVHCFEPMVRAYLRARWPGTPHAQDVDDAVQEVFVDCFRDGGILERADPNWRGGFRVFLYGVARIVAQRFERSRVSNREHAGFELSGMQHDERTLSRAYDRAWAIRLVREAVRRNHARAEHAGPDVRSRVEMLRLRFDQGLPIRELAPRLGMDPVRAHRQYARARREFRNVLLEVACDWLGCEVCDAEQECAELLRLLE